MSFALSPRNQPQRPHAVPPFQAEWNGIPIVREFYNLVGTGIPHEQALQQLANGGAR